uniref:Uncharacterized protein n=1 Tax=Calidris pygmaea TaxID=425635 RepID=A0A8C3KCM0_9CHAR
MEPVSAHLLGAGPASMAVHLGLAVEVSSGPCCLCIALHRGYAVLTELPRDVLPTHRHCQAMEDLVLEVHLSHTHGEVKWYKDGEKLQDTGRVRLEEDGARRLTIKQAELGDALAGAEPRGARGRRRVLLRVQRRPDAGDADGAG